MDNSQHEEGPATTLHGEHLAPSKEAASQPSTHDCELIIKEVYGDFRRPNWRPKPFEGRSRRYLWTDAFGVLNFLSLYQLSSGKDTACLAAADMLIDDVHETLGRHRDSKSRLGTATTEHPLRGGLRIGKGDEADDGQYFHYLTKWMFALNRMTVVTGDGKYNRLAVELVQAIHGRFLNKNTMGGPRLWWKMDVDLSRPLTLSQGNLDAVNGLVMYKLIQEESPDRTVLQEEIVDLGRLVARKVGSFTSSDELDLGEAIFLCSWYPDEAWSEAIIRESMTSVEALFRDGRMERSPAYRLMFREMGLSLGVQCVTDLAHHPEWRRRVAALHRFWADRIYDRDRDISPIMYVASVMPAAWIADRGYMLP